jgi:hypothetical protein
MSGSAGTVTSAGAPLARVSLRKTRSRCRRICPYRSAARPPQTHCAESQSHDSATNRCLRGYKAQLRPREICQAWFPPSCEGAALRPRAAELLGPAAFACTKPSGFTRAEAGATATVHQGRLLSFGTTSMEWLGCYLSTRIEAISSPLSAASPLYTTAFLLVTCGCCDPCPVVREWYWEFEVWNSNGDLRLSAKVPPGWFRLSRIVIRMGPVAPPLG